MRLTPCSELLLPQAQAILRQFADARHSIESLLAGVKGRLTIGSIPTVMPYLVAKRVSSFLIEYPDVDLQLIENTAPRLIDGLQAGDLDLAILSLPVTSPDMVCSELFPEPILLAAAPASAGVYGKGGFEGTTAGTSAASAGGALFHR
jgi:LysR family transcriptional regulator, hydrogen peroxide-inducible genes activator